MQVEATGDDKSPAGAEDTNLFIVVSYALDNGQLVVRSLNTDLVNTDLADTAALQAAFAANRNDPVCSTNLHNSGNSQRGRTTFLRNGNNGRETNHNITVSGSKMSCATR